MNTPNDKPAPDTWTRKPLVYRANKWQRDLADRLRGENDRLATVEDQGTQMWPGTPSLTDEIFARLYANRVPEVPEEERVPEAALARTLHDQIAALPEWKNLESATRYNAFWSGIGTTAMMEEVLPVLQKHHDDLQDAGMSQEMPTWIAGPAGDAAAAEGDEEAAAYYLAQGQAADVAEMMLPDEVDLGNAIRAGIARATAEVEDAKEIEGVLWGNQPGTIQPSTEGSLENPHVANLMTDRRFREIIKMAGRLFSIATTKRREKVDYARTEMNNVTINGDLNRALPSELLRLKHPRLRTLMLADYVEHRLLSYELTGKDKTGRGPVMVLLDTSGSMNANREVWGKGALLAIMNLCRKERRRVDAKFFDTAIRREWENLDRNFPRDPDAAQVVTTWGSGGGTNFYTALHATLTADFGKDDKGNMDVIMITDGECRLNADQEAEINALKDDRGASVYVINVAHTTLTDDAAPYADRVYNARVDVRPKQDDEACEIFTRI